jgi:cytoskeletal protein CcmA (bactofilin family)
MQITRFVGALSLAALLALVPLSASAATFMHPEQGQQSLVLSSGETFKNLYAAGNSLSINSQTEGDIIAAGRDITVGGAVSQDATLAGQTVIVNAPVSGDARIAGAYITINAPVSGDALLAASTIVITDKASIGNDAYFGAGEITINGTLAGKTNLSGQKVVINGPVTGDLTVYAESLVFGKTAKVTGKVKYYGPQAATVVEGAQVPAIAFEMMADPTNHKNTDRGAEKGVMAGLISAFFIIKLLAWALLAFILYKLFPRTAEHLVAKVQTNFWATAGIGFVGLILIPLAAVVLFAFVVGYSTALVVLLSYALLVFLATPLVVLTVGAWVYGKLAKKSTTMLGWQAVVIGALVVIIAKFIPILGGLAVFIITCAAFGALLKKLWWISQQQQMPPAETIMVEEVTITTIQ